MTAGFIEDKEQLDYLNKKLSGDNILLGAAGTGKSILALTLLMKAAQMDNVDNILFLAYSKTLISFCKKYNLEELAQRTHLFAAPDITIETFHSFFYQTFNKVYNQPPNIYQEAHADKNLLSEAFENCKNRYQDETIEFSKGEHIFSSELDYIKRLGFTQYCDYEESVRIGQGSKLSKEQRKYYWAVYEEYLRLLRENNFDCDFDNAANLLLKITSQNHDIEKYQFIIIDEGQDFSPTMIRAVHSLLSDNGVFLYIGDNTQEIFGSRVSWKSLGLNIRNKIKRLQSNYRNTIEIGNFAKDILDSNLWPTDTEEVLYPKNMVRHGILPILVDFDNEHIQNGFLRTFAKHYNTETTCILSYHKDDIKLITANLNSNGIKTLQLTDKIPISQDLNEFKCFTCTYHSIKGLDFDNIIVVGFDQSFLENIEHVHDNNEKLSLAMKLFYIACTRAKKRLIISSCGEVSGLFPTESKHYQTASPFELLTICKDKNTDAITTETAVAALAEKVLLQKIDLMEHFEKAVKEAKTELDIHSPWMTRKVVDDLFLDKIRRLLQRNVVVKIAYGIQDDSHNYRKNTETDKVVAMLKKEFGHNPNFRLKKINSHGKKIICDLDYAIVGSYNWLSYTGISDREEDGAVFYKKEEIQQIREEHFAF